MTGPRSGPATRARLAGAGEHTVPSMAQAGVIRPRKEYATGWMGSEGWSGSKERVVKDEKITPEIVKARAALAGVTFDEGRLDDVAATMEQSLAPLRKVDLRAIRMVEPALVFRAAWSE